MEIGHVSANGFEFRCRRAGSQGEPVVLLHGFPETSAEWLELMAELVAAGYRCLAFDQRGISPGARPLDVDEYALDRLGSDVIALADACGFQRFHLVGHDWGAAAGWIVVRDHAPRVASWSALSVPHIAAYGAAFELPEHRAHVGYIDATLVPGKLEEELSRNGFEQLYQAWASFAPHNVPEYASVFTQPGALTAMLNWYRANFASPAQRERAFARFDVWTPTLTLWGKQDPFVGRPATLHERDFMRGPYRFVELDAGHRLMHEARELCCREILAHVQAHPVMSLSAPGPSSHHRG